MVSYKAREDFAFIYNIFLGVEKKKDIKKYKKYYRKPIDTKRKC